MPNHSLRSSAFGLALIASLSACGASEGAPEGPAQDLDMPRPHSQMIAPDPEIPPERPLEYSGLPPYAATLPARFDPARTFTAKEPLPALSGGTAAVTDTGLVVAADPDRALVYLIDVANKTYQSIPLKREDEPGRVAVRGQTAYVALRGSGEVATIDLSTRDVARTSVCALPRGLTVSEDSLLVACASGELVKFDAKGKEVQRLAIADDLRDVGVDAQGIWVSRYRSAELLRVLPDGSIASRTRPGLTNASVEARGDEPRSPTLAARTISDGRGHVYMLHQQALTSPIRPEFNGYGSLFSPCSPSIVQPAIAGFSDDAAPAVKNIPNTVLPVDLALSPDGKRLAAVSPGGLWQQDAPDVVASSFGEFGPPSSGPIRQLALLSSDQVYSSAGGECASGASQLEHRFPGEAESVVFLDNERFAVLVREPSELRVFTFDQRGFARLTSVIDLDPSSVLDTGHQLFHIGTPLGIACASCHGEGQDDGHVWNFEGIGERRTQSLLGGVLASAPFHWDGDQKDMRALADEVFTRRMGGPSLNDGWLSALSGYIDALPNRATTVKDAASVARGKALFEGTLHCNTCHRGSEYRTPGSFNVGTGGNFQVPSLLGVSQRLPLMHNGCGTTLRARFDPECGGTDHGDTQGLSEAQLSDLIAFLSSL